MSKDAEVHQNDAQVYTVKQNHTVKEGSTPRSDSLETSILAWHPVHLFIPSNAFKIHEVQKLANIWKG